jgi:aarF domain-containing kinase
MLGPAFVKLTQWAATRRDLFSSKICDQLSTIQTSNPVVHSWAHTDHVLREAFGSNYSDYLRIQHPTKASILGSGCVAQVYRGELLIPTDDHGGGNDDETNTTIGGGNIRAVPVAIKVLHPHISEKIDRDLTFMKRIAHLIDSLLPTSVLCAVNIPRVVEHFEDIIRRQVDLRIEAHNLRKFHTNFPSTSIATNTNERHYAPTVEFPKPLMESKNVLIEELVAATEDILEETSLVNDTFSTSLSLFLTGSGIMPQQQRIIKRTTTVRPISSFIQDNSQEGLLIRKQLARPLLQSFLKVR